MPFEKASPAVVGKKVDGPVCKMQVRRMSRGPSKIRFFLNGSFLEEYLGNARPGDTVSVSYGTGDEKGLVMLTRAADGDCVVHKYGRSAVSLSLLAWRGFINSNHAAKPCRIKTANKNGVVIEIPKFKEDQ